MKLILSLILLLGIHSVSTAQRSYSFDLSVESPCPSVGIEEKHLQFTIFPNPAKNVVHIRVPEGETNVLLYTISGILVKKTILHSGKLNMDVKNLRAGLYMLFCESASGNFHTKLQLE